MDPSEDWAIISIDGVITRAKIMHKSRGKYIIVEDSKDGKYINRKSMHGYNAGREMSEFLTTNYGL